MKELWKKFDEVEMTHSSVHHLMAIYELLKKNGYVRGVDVAKYLDISRSSVSITMKKLISRGYVVEDENKFYKFTSQGEALINSVLSKRHIIKMFFEEVLGLSEKLAEEEACKIEHLLEEETGQKFMSFMGFYLSGRKEVSAFKKSIQSFNYECSEAENCDICEISCYFAKAGSESNPA